MRILVVSFRFAPYASMGAARLAGFCAEWERAGHKVYVVTADQPTAAKTLELPVPESQIRYAPWKAPAGAEQGRQMARSGWKRVLVRLYLSAVLDTKLSWIKPAIAAADEFDPDVIFASGLPISSLLAGWEISKRKRKPWVAELRDPWIGNPYAVRPLPPFEWYRLQAQRSMNPKQWVVTSPGTQKLLREQGCESEIVMTGVTARPPQAAAPETLTLVHTGQLYGGQRDPTPILQALDLLEPADRARVRVEFYGEHQGDLDSKTKNYENVISKGLVTRQEALAAQDRADVLLLITPNRPEERLFIPGKLFEYMGAQRTIWVIGHEESGAAEMVRDHRLGEFLEDPAAIADAIRNALKFKPGELPRPEDAIDQGLTVAAQAAKLLTILEKASK